MAQKLVKRRRKVPGNLTDGTDTEDDDDEDGTLTTLRRIVSVLTMYVLTTRSWLRFNCNSLLQQHAAGLQSIALLDLVGTGTNFAASIERCK